LPFLLLLYVLAFLDRANVGFAKATLLAETGLSDAAYAFGAGVFFAGYALLEVPSNLILHRVGARVWLCRIMVSWGLVSAAMMLACSLGSRFGMITVMDELVVFCERNIRNYGMESRVARPVRVHRLGENWVNALFEMLLTPEVLFPRFEELCHACIADGAEVILPCCCALSPALSLAGYREVPGTGVPIVDVTHAAVKLAETLVDLKRAVGLGKSQRCAYKSAPPEIRDAMRSLTYRAPGKGE